MNVPENVWSEFPGKILAMISEHRARDDPLIQQDPTAVTLTWNHSGGELLLLIRPLRLRKIGTLNALDMMGGVASHFFFVILQHQECRMLRRQY